ncbi:HIT family protein [Parahaliea maris]|uniref:HIT family protein n=2 Tax=Parahaliea maris TaxID=2716870 RepID=A0A5C8ZWG3_9GAMM|nr:HIT family protein [Parahaliea maris]
MGVDDCPFCDIAQGRSNGRILQENPCAFLIADGFPITEGHSLIIPKRHVSSFFLTTEDERKSLLDLVDHAKSYLDQKFSPDSYNIGINDGPSAGQTIPHLHIHLIPRYCEPGVDPRGGIRWIVPEKASYWSDR